MVSAQRRNSRQAATILRVSFAVIWSGVGCAGPAASMAWSMSAESSVKMPAMTCLISSSWLPKYR